MFTSTLQSPTFSAINALRDAVLALQQARIETASLDARLLLQCVLGLKYEQWLSNRSVVLSLQQYEAYFALVEKRKQHQPIAQLIGARDFWDSTFRVTFDTLDPRPDSESLIEAVLERMTDPNAKLRILDLGTGTGCLLLTLLKLFPNASGVGVDISEPALAVAQENADRLQLGERVVFTRSSWGENVEGVFDIVISNPPYIPSRMITTLAPEVRCFEPMLALDGGEDGLECYRKIVPQLQQFLVTDGLAVFEVGQGQEKELGEIVGCYPLSVIGIRRDLAGIIRCVVIQKQRS